ncbi:hypothetical protein PENSPDRAFT_708220 [Peniophora sp. CONT]|nr:hypothetical protein PENSPDRAFT_708220 [Peniophora sp. CONT]
MASSVSTVRGRSGTMVGVQHGLTGSTVARALGVHLETNRSFRFNARLIIGQEGCHPFVKAPCPELPMEVDFNVKGLVASGDTGRLARLLWLSLSSPSSATYEYDRDDDGRPTSVISAQETSAHRTYALHDVLAASSERLVRRMNDRIAYRVPQLAPKPEAQLRFGANEVLVAVCLSDDQGQEQSCLPASFAVPALYIFRSSRVRMLAPHIIVILDRSMGDSLLVSIHAHSVGRRGEGAVSQAPADVQIGAKLLIVRMEQAHANVFETCIAGSQGGQGEPGHAQE